MTDQQKSTALALLRSGRSYQEAADASKLPVSDVMAVWNAMRRLTPSAWLYSLAKPSGVVK